MTSPHRLGAVPGRNGVSYRVWAPETRAVQVEIHRQNGVAHRLALSRDEAGYHEGDDPPGRPGDRYFYHLDGGPGLPDPVSRAQTHGVHGPSLVVDPALYHWQDATWRRPTFRDLVIYEVHVGTVTPEGTFRAVCLHLPRLRDLGVTALEIMPVADFPGTRNWGYDGVLPYAPAACYGSPDDFRSLVDAAHRLGLAVILDVVYNHLGPDGNYLETFSPHYFHPHRHTPWGRAFNFDGEKSGPVREYFGGNPRYWMEEFHVDGFRFDAVHEIPDKSSVPLLQEMTTQIHRRGGYAIAEDPRNMKEVVTPEAGGGLGFEAVWADDFHHSVRVGQTGEKSAYYQDFQGNLAETVDILAHGWLYRGQISLHAGTPRGSPCRVLPPERFVHCISNHDQAGNRARGERLHHLIPPECHRALSALLCLSPYTPLIFMGQEWAASTPFLFFTDHREDLGRKITEGRRAEFSSFPEFADPSARETIPDPQDIATFQQSQLRWEECSRPRHTAVHRLYADCLKLRRHHAAFRPRGRESWRVGILPGEIGILLLQDNAREFAVVFDLHGGHTARLPDDRVWSLVLSTEERCYAGSGVCPFETRNQTVTFDTATTLVFETSRPSAGQLHTWRGVKSNCSETAVSARK